MKKTNTKTRARYRPPEVFLAVAALFVLILAGCSHTADPPFDDGLGTINMRLTLVLPQGPESVGAEAAQPVVDSVAVLVFRGGSGAALEVKKGVPVPGSTTEIDVSVRCVAESGKKVGVELFDGGTMVYFGVDGDVTVRANRNTDVTIDAVDIWIDDVVITPVLAAVDETVSLSWDGVRAVGAYLVQESRTEYFDSVVWETLTTDTLLLLTRGLGPHFFRVVPVNQYTNGTSSKAVYCYVASAGELPPSITGVAPAAVPPGGYVTISGVNLDLPGTEIYVGSSRCLIVSAREDEMTIQIPLTGQTDHIYLWSILGTYYSPDPLVVQRIAFVTGDNAGDQAAGWIPLITYDPAVIRWSGVDVIVVDQLDSRDMSVFDLIVVANDTGDLAGNWGNNPARAQAVAASGAQVLAIGVGGAEYLGLTHADFTGREVAVRAQTSLFVPDAGLLIFSSPYQVPIVGPGELSLCSSPEDVVAFRVDAGIVPSHMWLYATYIDDQNYYPIMDSMVGSGQTAVISFFWGYDGNPTGMTPTANGFFLNVINMLMSVKPVAPARE